MDELSRRPVLGDSTAWNTVDDQTVETPRTQHDVRAMRGILRHPVSGISDVDPHRTIRGHLACIATTGATRDEEQEDQCCEPSGGSAGARQSLTERQPGTPWKKAPNDCDHPPTAIQKGGNAALYYEGCEMCGNRWQRIPLIMMARDPETTLAEQSHSACVHREATGRSMMMQTTPQQSLHLECSTCSATSGLSLDGCDVRLVDRGTWRVPTRTWFLLGTTRHRASKSAEAAEWRGPGGLSPVDL